MIEAAVTPGLAFLAGLASFLSPCVLPIVPSYVGFVTGLTLDELRADGADARAARRRAALLAALFVLGFSTVFVALGAGASAAGRLLRDALPALQVVGGVVVVLFGAHLLGVLRVPALLRERRLTLARRPAGAAGAFVVGVAFGAGWTPCIGPVLGTVLLLASMEPTMARGVGLLAVFALGLGVPFWLSAVALNAYLAGAGAVRRALPWLSRAAGAALVAVGLLMATGRMAALSASLARFAPPVTVDVAPSSDRDR